MKSHATKEQCFAGSGLSEDKRAAFYAGWYAAGNEINQGEDSDWLSESLKANDFLEPDEKPDEDDYVGKEPDATHFRVGDVWISPVGTVYKVEQENGPVVRIRCIASGSPLLSRGRDSIGAHTGRPWTRRSWGGKP